MLEQLQQILRYLLIATGAGTAGGILTVFWKPSVHWRSAVKHFAGDLVIAAVAMEVLPEIRHTGTATGVLGGFIAGGLL